MTAARPGETAPAAADPAARRPRAMTGAEFRLWKNARGYDDSRQLVADLATPLPRLSIAASEIREVPPDIDRLCRLVALVDEAAWVAPGAPDLAADRELVAQARRLLAAWEMPLPCWAALRSEEDGRADRREWQRRRWNRGCTLSAFVKALALSRSFALVGIRERAAAMIAGWAP